MTWWQRVVRRRRVEAQLADELHFHLERHAADLIAEGVEPNEARRRARVALGGPEQVKEDCRDARGTRWLDDFVADVRYALRTFRRLPGFAVVAVLVLGLGIAATTVMFAMVDGVLLRPLPYPDSDQLISLRGYTDAFGESAGISYPDFLDIRRDVRSLTVAAWKYSGGTVSAPGDAEYVDAREVSADLFDVLGTRLVRGRTFVPDEDREDGSPVAIISQRMWQRRYAGAANVVDQPLMFDGRRYTVIGVAPAGLSLDGEADVFTSLGRDSEPRMQNREARFLRVVGRLHRDASLIAAQAELTVIGRRLATRFPQSNAGRELRARSLQQEVVGDTGPPLWLLMAAVMLVLLIACVNVASLLLARAVSRGRELATRVALGATRGRVIRQCLAESAVLAAAGGVLGLLCAAAGLRPFVALWPGTLPRAGEIALDWRVLSTAVLVTVGSGIAFGIAPAFCVPVAGLEPRLRAVGRTITSVSRRLHSAFVVIELALTIVLLVSAGMLGRTLIALTALDPGLNVRNVLTARVALSPAVLGNPRRIAAAWQEVLDRARGVPGVASAALTDIVPMRTGNNTLPYSTSATAPTADNAPVALASSVTPDYLRVMGIPLLDGRFVDDHDRFDTEPVVVVDDNLAGHAFGRSDVVGRYLWVSAMGPSPLRIVGVVGHVRHWGLASDDQSRVRDQMYYPFAQVPLRLLRTFSGFMSIALRTAVSSSDIVEPLRRELRGTAADQALYDVHTMEQLVGASLARQRFLALLFAVFGGVSLVLATVGVYGVLAYLTRQRTAEIAVRMALGATRADIMRLVVGQSAALLATGVAIGTSGAWAAARVLHRLVAGVGPADPLTFSVMTAALIVAALLASALPARRAGQVAPIQALRAD